jgi:hypothetical protein
MSKFLKNSKFIKDFKIHQKFQNDKIFKKFKKKSVFIKFQNFNI